MSSFFTLPASQRKRKRVEVASARPTKLRGIDKSTARTEQSSRSQTKPREVGEEDSISGSESEDENEPETPEESEASSEEGETAAERRVRLAQRYLDSLKEEVDEVGFDAKDLDDDLVAKRLREDVDEAKGRQFRLIANRLDLANAAHCFFRADTLATTGVAVCQPYAYTVSKDTTLIKWKLQSPQPQTKENGIEARKQGPGKKRPEQMAYVKGIKIRASASQQHGHTGPILAVAASPEGRFVATGGADRKIIIWSTQDLTPLKTFPTHRDKVLGLAFAPSTASQPGLGAQLFSASADRSIKTYSLASEESLAYVETLFGHQDHVIDVSAMSVDHCVSVGARDRSARLWKVVDETQLKFLGDSALKDQYQTGSLDCIAALPPQHFVTGSDAGVINLWSIHKKKASFTIRTAHGVDEPPLLDDVTSEADPRVVKELKRVDKRRPIPRSITALVAIPGTDTILSGSWDGWIRVWKVSDDKRSLMPLGKIGDAAHTQDTQDNHETDQSDRVASATSPAMNGAEGSAAGSSDSQGPIRGIINSIAAFERRKEVRDAFGGKKEGDIQGLCIVAGIGKEPRVGSWMKASRGRNAAMVFEVPILS